jgi:diguanylate cyclase
MEDSLSYILVDVGLATVALIIGFCSALAYARHTFAKPPAAPSPAEELAKAELLNQNERASMAALQLRDLTRNVAADVSDHNATVDGFSTKLEEALRSGDHRVVAEAIATMVAANEKLQGRLSEAEKKIQAQAEELRTQETEARTDALTKLANRRAFDAAMETNIQRFHSERRTFSMLLFDVDHFKKFNDTHGHQAGDEVLRAVGHTLTKTVKTTDVPCRYGGEEFALIMPGTKVEHARIAAERVRKAIEAMAITFEGKNLKVTASIGLAEIGSGEDVTRIIRRADDAVYASKEAGRNCSHWHDGVECLPISQESNLNKIAAAAAAQASTPDPQLDLQIEPGTGVDLPDKSVFVDELRRRVSESHRFGVALSVLHLRVKDYQDLEMSYGKAVGQLLLDSVASFIRTTLREMDLLGKFDRDEFIVMLPGSSENEAKQVGRRVKTAISNCSIPLGRTQIKLELHLGASHVRPEDDAQSLMARARRFTDAAAALELEATSELNPAEAANTSPAKTREPVPAEASEPTTA